MRVPPRRLTVLASLDVAGYTRLVEADERGTLSELAAVRLKIIRPTLAAHGGNLFKTMGDGALIEFPNVEDSVRWAMAFQTAMAARNAARGARALRVRLGIGLADVYVQGQDRFGAAVGFVVLYARTHPLAFQPRWHRVRELLRDSWPLAIAGAAAMVSLRIDQVMLRQMSPATELGMYAAAARLSEVWYFVPVALGTALLPALVASHADRERHDRRLQVALDVALWSAIGIALAVTFLGGIVIAVLYGSRFEGAADILRLQLWAGPFVFMGVISGRALLAQGLQRVEALRYVVGAPLNVGLNLLLIPRFDGAGAAVATLISYIAVTYLLLLAHPKTRHTGWLMTRAFLLPWRLRTEYLGTRRLARASAEEPGIRLR